MLRLRPRARHAESALKRNLIACTLGLVAALHGLAAAGLRVGQATVDQREKSPAGGIPNISSSQDQAMGTAQELLKGNWIPKVPAETGTGHVRGDALSCTQGRAIRLVSHSPAIT
jgi:hypothetical protein